MGKQTSGAWGESAEKDESAYSYNPILSLWEAPVLQAITDDYQARKRAWPGVKAAIMADRDRRDQAYADGTLTLPTASKPKSKLVMPAFWKKKRAAMVKSS